MSNQPNRSIAGDRATVPGALPLHKTTVIGITLTASQNAAVLRLRDGQIARVKTGDILNGSEIAAIDQDGLVLIENGTATRLPLAA